MGTVPAGKRTNTGDDLIILFPVITYSLPMTNTQ